MDERPEDPQQPDLEDDEQEEAGEAGTIADDRYAFFEQYREGALRKKSVREFPRLFREALRIVLGAARRDFLISTVIQSVEGAAAGVVLVLGKEALESILRAQTLRTGFTEVIPKLLIVAA